MDPTPPVSIIILNYNGHGFIKGCLDSLLSQTYPSYEILFVDNASTDGSAAIVANDYPSVRLIRNERNLGFAEGNNVGVAFARCDLVVLVNNDVVAESGWLAALVDAIKDPDVSVASSLVKTVGVPDLFYERNGTLNFLGHNVMLAFEDPMDIFFCTGCSLIFRKSEIGEPFDPDYFAYAEDSYLGFRARFAGGKVRHAPESRLFHFGGGTAKDRPSAFLAFYQERNRLLNMLLFFGIWTRLRLVPYFGFNVAAKTLKGLARSRSSLAGWWRAWLWLVSHPGIISRKRAALAAFRRVDESKILRLMSSRVIDSESGLARFVNGLAVLYCRIVGLECMERHPQPAILTNLRSKMRK